MRRNKKANSVDPETKAFVTREIGAWLSGNKFYNLVQADKSVAYLNLPEEPGNDFDYSGLTISISHLEDVDDYVKKYTLIWELPVSVIHGYIAGRPNVIPSSSRWTIEGLALGVKVNTVFTPKGDRVQSIEDYGSLSINYNVRG